MSDDDKKALENAAWAIEKHNIEEVRLKETHASAAVKQQLRADSGQAIRTEIEVLTKEFNESSKELIDKSMQGYDSFTSAMMSIVSHWRKFAVLMSKVNLVVSGVNLVASAFGLDYESRQSKADNKMKPVEDSEVVLPMMSQFVEFENDHLKESSLFDNLRFSHNGKRLKEAGGAEQGLVEAAERCFRSEVDAWLKRVHGYEKREGTEPNTYYKNDGSGDKLTTTEFNNLRDNPTTGLNAFLEEYTGLAFEQRAAAAPAADDEDHSYSPRPR